VSETILDGNANKRGRERGNKAKIIGCEHFKSKKVKRVLQ
jgi:hypothetical protein